MFADEKVVILICDSFSFKSKQDETIVGQTIERVFSERGNGFVAWLKNGKLSVDPDVLVQFLVPTSAASQPGSEPNFQETTRGAQVSAPGYSYLPQHDPRQRNNPPEWETGHGWNVPMMQQPMPQVAATIQPRNPPTAAGELVMLRTLLRYGVISLKEEDIQIWDPEFIVPDYIVESLFHNHCKEHVTGVRIVLDKNGVLQTSVDPKLVQISTKRNEGIQIAQNETLVLKTSIRKGLVSFHEGDVHFRHGIWQIPQHIIDSLREEFWSTPCGDLYIISDKERNLRYIVNIGPYNRMRTFAKKHGL